MNKNYLTKLFKAGVITLLFCLPGLVQAQIFNGTGGVLPNVNGQTITFDLNVAGLPGDGILNKDVGIGEVCVDIQHTWALDLQLTLITPSGRQIRLTLDDGGTSGWDARVNHCFSDNGNAPIEDWNFGSPAGGNPWIPEDPLNATCDDYVGPDTANGTWTLQTMFTSTVGGQNGTLFGWTLEIVPLLCTLDGIVDTTLFAPPGICENIPLTLPDVTGTGCVGVPTGPTESSGQIPYVFVNNNTFTPQTPAIVDVSAMVAAGPACAPIIVVVDAEGDHGGGGTFEGFNLVAPDGVDLITGWNTSGDCVVGQQMTFNIPQAQFDGWVAAQGSNMLEFLYVARGTGTNDFCANDHYQVTITYPTDCSLVAVNSHTGTGSASGNYPVGVTCATWCTVDAATGIEIICPQKVTVLVPFNECNDLIYHAGPGECSVAINYDTALACPFELTPMVLSNEDTLANDANSWVCNFTDTRGFVNIDHPANYKMESIALKIMDGFLGGYPGGANLLELNIYSLAAPGSHACANRTLIASLGGLPIPIPPAGDPVLSANNWWKLDIPDVQLTNAGQILVEMYWNEPGAPFAARFPFGMPATTTNMSNLSCDDPCTGFLPRVENWGVYICGAIDARPEIIVDGPRPWEYMPIGMDTVCLTAIFSTGDTITCKFSILVEEFPNNITALACNDLIQLSLDETCMATVGADMILEGGPYGCYDDYIVILTDNVGNIVDFDNDTSNGTQLSNPHIGNCYWATVTDPETGNSCWGQICIEDKLPPVVIDCPNDTVDCDAPIDPLCFGGNIPCPTVADACDPFLAATFVDWETRGSCALGFEKIISRRWTFTDDSGNSATCEQVIYKELFSLFDVIVPSHWDGLDNPALQCDEKYDENKLPPPLVVDKGHILAFPFCVDGYLLDSAIWLATGGDPTIPDPDARDLSGTRLPRQLGWNCLDSGPYAGHPSPFPIYYEPHPQWEFFGVCWGPDAIVKWQGTGFPTGVTCSNIIATYEDIVLPGYDPDCDAGDVGCFDILRKWTLTDWCTGEVGGHVQRIKIMDNEGPEIVAPDDINVGTDVWYCLGRLDVPPVWIVDNCSNDVEYTVTTKYGTVFGNSTTGYVIVDIPLGDWPLYIEAFDCCGNRSVDSIIMHVEDNTPPVCIAEDRVQLSLAGSQSPGSNFAAVCAVDLDKASYDNCTHDISFKMIRMDELLGTVNGSFLDNTDACGGINGDDDGLIDGNQVYFDDCAKFCCDDADQIIMVVLRVFDVLLGPGPVHPLAMTPPGGGLVGHFTDCWVEIDVRDKAQPLVVAPPDIVVSCMFWFDDSEDALTDINNPTFGRVVTDLNDRQKVKTIDVVCEEWCEDHPHYGYEPIRRNTPLVAQQACAYYNQYFNDAHPEDKYELVWGFDGYAIRTCGTTPTISVDDRRECGQGVILRDVRVTYVDPKTGASVSFRDRQEIWVIDCDPFYAVEDCFDDEDCIEWPLFCQQPDPLDGCGADLDPYTNTNLDYPRIVNGCDDNCALVAVEYDDEVYSIEDTACFKVLRTWTVIDWCTYDPLAPETRDGDNPNMVTDGRWEFLQVIVVRDKIDPVVTIDMGDCEPAVKDANWQCWGHLDLCATATDDCSPDTWLVYDYKIDLWSDGDGVFGDFDLYVGKMTLQQFNNFYQLDDDTLANCAFYNQDGYCNPYADDPTQPFCASGTYPVGTHTIYWFVEDGCGNVKKEVKEFEILDCKEPTPYCKNGIITVVMPVNGEICIWASDLDDGSFDNCTEQENLKFYFNGDTSLTSYCVNCDTFDARGADDKILIDVEVWVEDEEGNKDFCVTTIEVQDNNDVCDGPGSIVGTVENMMMHEMLEGAEMYSNGTMTMLTDNGGGYKVPIVAGEDYTIKPSKDDDHGNGISTADLVAIQRHLLGKAEFTTAEYFIAGDVNNNSDVSAADIAALRKFILGYVTDFSQWNGQTSWRFVDTDHTFADQTQPWGWPEERVYTNVPAGVYGANFHAVKIGDVTGDADNNGLIGNGTRGAGNLSFLADAAELTAGETYRMDVRAKDFVGISGYQFTMELNEAVTFAGVESGVLSIAEANVGTAAMNNGLITMSWSDIYGNAISANNDEVLFTVVLNVQSSAQLSDVVSLNSIITKAEAYDADLNVKTVSLDFGTGTQTAAEFELYQNTPNPFKASTVISFNLPGKMPAVLTVYDVAGKVLMVRNIDGDKGYNEELISQSELNGAGVLYYQLDAADYTATKRMVLID